MKYRIIATFLLLAALTQAEAQTQAPAFPGAEGFARLTTSGGRGGEVYHVTNLNDSGTGSLRDALSKDNRIIVFDVSGYIDLKSDLRVQHSNITIAGQTAPGDGITLRYYTFNLADAKANNIIIRFLRFRRSQVKNVNDGADAAWGRNNKNVIFDHCSFSWSIDETASFYDNASFTMQWCTVGEGLNNAGHDKGAHGYGGIWGGKEASFHHNLIIHENNRTPRLNGARYGWDGYDHSRYSNTIEAEVVDLRNNLIYNWGQGNGAYAGQGGYHNIVGNYYKAGPATKNKTRVFQCGHTSNDKSDNGSKIDPDNKHIYGHFYIDGNYVSAASSPANYDWQGVIIDDSNATIQDTIRLSKPVATGDVTTHRAEDAYEKILQYCGASYVRDAVDARYMEEVRTSTAVYTGTATKTGDGKTISKWYPGIIDLINDPSKTADTRLPSFPELKEETRSASFDTDRDGMPDEWETANGLNPNDASDAKSYSLDDKGYYTNVEVYLNSLVEDIVRAQNADAVTSVAEYYPSCSKPSALDTVSSAPVRFLYYDLNGHPVSHPSGGIFIRKQIFSDGSVVTDKVIAP